MRLSSPKRTRLRSAVLTTLMVACLGALPARTWAATCNRDQLATAVDSAGEKLRQLTAVTQPVLQQRLIRLKDAKGWSDTDYEEKAYAALEDDRIAKFDTSANELLARIDQLGGDRGGAAPDCNQIAEIEAASLELQATVRAKSQYVLTRLDQMMVETAPQPPRATPAAPAAPPPVVTLPPAPPKTTATAKADPRWSTQTRTSPPATTPPPPPVAPVVADAAPAAPPPPSQTSPPIVGDGFSIDEIVNASGGLFGKVSANLAGVLEHAFAKSGRPTAYVLGQETGGAFIAGLRYGKGTLYLRSGGSMPVYWHGPSIGADVGAQGASALFLIYKLNDASDVFSSFSGIEGSAFVVGGLGLTFMTNNRIDMAPIRSGLGLRLGANLGYIRFTNKPTWNPF